jgi:hypothetical protein
MTPMTRVMTLAATLALSAWACMAAEGASGHTESGRLRVALSLHSRG